jgi:hypothetical protein
LLEEIIAVALFERLSGDDSILDFVIDARLGFTTGTRGTRTGEPTKGEGVIFSLCVIPDPISTESRGAAEGSGEASGVDLNWKLVSLHSTTGGEGRRLGISGTGSTSTGMSGFVRTVRRRSALIADSRIVKKRSIRAGLKTF